MSPFSEDTLKNIKDDVQELKEGREKDNKALTESIEKLADRISNNFKWGFVVFIGLLVGWLGYQNRIDEKQDEKIQANQQAHDQVLGNLDKRTTVLENNFDLKKELQGLDLLK